MITHGRCGDPNCYRGGIGDWNYQYKDGPCQSPNCQWPKDQLTARHFSDNPAKLLTDGHGRYWWAWE